MQVGRIIALMSISFLLSSCNVSDQTDMETAGACPIKDRVWHRGMIEPPNRVLYWDIIVTNYGLVVNGVHRNVKEFSRELESAREYRPSPYLILHKGRKVSCAYLLSVSSFLSNSLDCSKNYCYYSE